MPKGDADATIRSFVRVGGPVILVGHSYGGTVITHAGMDIDRDDGTARGEQNAGSHRG
jgi:alpha-beta hydrolase superfamily lysophospholipase